jgi:hypothetical protein
MDQGLPDQGWMSSVYRKQRMKTGHQNLGLPDPALDPDPDSVYPLQGLPVLANQHESQFACQSPRIRLLMGSALLPFFPGHSHRTPRDN